MATKYEVFEGDTWRWISSWDTLADANRECDRLNAKTGRQYFIHRVVDGIIYR